MAIQLNVPSIVCDSCANVVTKAIHKVDAAANVSVDVATKQVAVDTQASESALREAIAAAGHKVD